MIGVDTNILVRYLTQDDENQAKIVDQLFKQYATSANSIFINNIVICELIWVLESGYKYSRLQISEAIKQILSTEEFSFENQKLLRFALNQYSQNKLDFSDSLIGAINNQFDCLTTFTFDKSSKNTDNFSYLK